MREPMVFYHVFRKVCSHLHSLYCGFTLMDTDRKQQCFKFKMFVLEAAFVKCFEYFTADPLK